MPFEVLETYDIDCTELAPLMRKVNLEFELIVTVCETVCVRVAVRVTVCLCV